MSVDFQPETSVLDFQPEVPSAPEFGSTGVEQPNAKPIGPVGALMHLIGQGASAVGNAIVPPRNTIHFYWGPQKGPIPDLKNDWQPVYKPGVPVFPASVNPNDTPLVKALKGLKEGITTPEGMAVGAAGLANPAIAATLFAPQGVEGALTEGPKQVATVVSPDATRDQREEAAYGALANVLMAAGGMKGVAPEAPRPSGLGPGDVKTVPKVEDYPTPETGEPPVPAARQLRDSAFRVAPEGTTVDFQELSPREQAEFSREADAQSLQTESGQERLVNTVRAGLGQKAPASPELINDLLRVEDPGTKVRGVQEFPNDYERNQEMPFREAWTAATARAGIGNFYVKIGDRFHPAQSLDDLTGGYKAAVSRGAKPLSFDVYNREGLVVGRIGPEGFSAGAEGPVHVMDQLPGGPTKALPKPPAPGDKGGMHSYTYTPEDLQRYWQLRQDQREMRLRGNMMDPKTGEMSPEWLANQREYETIRNKYAGMPPQQERPANAIRELRTDRLSKEQASRDIPPVGEEVRPGAEAPGAKGETGSVGGQAASVTPAIRYADRVYTGGAHLPAVMKLQKDLSEKGLTPKQIDVMTSYAERGWVDEKGKFTLGDLPEKGPDTSSGGLQVKKGLGKQGEAGFVDLRAAIDAFKGFSERFGNSVRGGKVGQEIARTKDRAENAAHIIGQRAGRALGAMAADAFGKNRAKAAVEGLTAAIEANGDRAKLATFIRQAGSDKRALAAAQFAQANWDRLQPLVQRAQELHDLAYDEAAKAGIPIDKREGYVRHLYDLSKIPAQLLDKFLGSGSGGKGGSGYKKGRVYETLFDAVEAGKGDAIKTWDASALVENRLRAGFLEINDQHWVKLFKNVMDPVTGKAVVTDFMKHSRTGEAVPPPGYVSFEVTPGRRFAVMRQYEKEFRKVQAVSFIRDMQFMGLPVGEALMKAGGTLKHSLLLFDTFHAVRESAFAGSLGTTGYNKGLALLEYFPRDLATAVRTGAITREMADWANANRGKANKVVQAGLNIGRVTEAIDADVIRRLPFAGPFNKWVFEKLTRGAMLESAVGEFDRVKAANPRLSDEAVAKQVARDLNFRFGNIGRQGLFRSKSMQDTMRVFFLAPQWFESMAQSEGRSIGQLGKAAVTGKMGTLGKSTATLVAAMVVATQIANIASKGKPTWDNPEGHKFEAWVPGGENGFYVSPLSIPMELAHDMIRYMRSGKNVRQAAVQIIENKFSPLLRAEETLRTGRDYTGRKLAEDEVVKMAAENVLPLPLPAQAALKKGGSVERQVLASAGIKAEPAETDLQRVTQLARKWKNEHGVKEGDYPESDYLPLVSALRRGKADVARKELEKLTATKGEQAIDRYFQSYQNRIYTGSKEREDAFFQSLSKEDQQRYEAVRESNAKIREDYFNLTDRSPKATKRRRRFSAFSYENHD